MSTTLYPRPDVQELVRADHAHVIHPLHHPTDHQAPAIFVKGEGATLIDAEGKRYIDGLSCLWNVNVGHGRRELADAAYRQMLALEYATFYPGASNVPAIELAGRILEHAYPNMSAVFFTSGGAESNEAAFKTARFYWKARGKPAKTKIISRTYAYHGATLAAMSATGIEAYWPMFEPRVPGFSHAPAPYPFRYEGHPPYDQVGRLAAEALEREVLAQGPETVAAVIGEPVQGAGGVIVPPPDYWPRVRAICDRYELLLIADEVITGFGRTGRWFALEHWGVVPDIVAFAKGITSGYFPLGGIMVSRAIHEAILSVPPESRWMQAYTYSGHPTGCAVGLANLAIIERERLVERAAAQGRRLLARLETLYELPEVGEVRGLGLMAAVELAADRQTRAPFPRTWKVGDRVRDEARRRGLFTRAIRDVILLAPPLVVTDEEIDRLVEILREAIPAGVAAGRAAAA
ncbi:MAG TPA: aspartate aminotransferase family protein [Thermodesulfobacteriota bacterium]|nr:aspartate aminotransferase family protein [Thermodesulfobacteriota bacterium]